MLYLNSTPLNVTKFPDNTSQVWKIPDYLLEQCKTSVGAAIRWRFDSEGEFLHVAQLKDLLAVSGVQKVSLHLGYLPYGRQDKAITHDATFALRTFALLLNELNFDYVSCLDPHSKAAGELIKRFRPVWPVGIVKDYFDRLKADVVCYPDKGALLKYAHMMGLPFIHGEKVRDQLTGNITSYELVGDPVGKTVLIVDDICDGGATFKLLTKALLERGAAQVNLYVSHGIFSKGVRTLFESGIHRIFTYEGEVGARHGTFQL